MWVESRYFVSQDTPIYWLFLMQGMLFPAPGQSSVSQEGRKSIITLICCCCCSVAKLYLTLCNSMNCCTPGFPVHHPLPELAQTHVHRVGDAIQTSHSLLLVWILLSFSPENGGSTDTFKISVYIHI